MKNLRVYGFLFFFCFILEEGICGKLSPRRSDEISGSSIGVAESHVSFFGVSPVGDDIIKKCNLSGMKWARIFLEWNLVESDTNRIPRYIFSDYKRNLSRLVSLGITPYGVLGSNNKSAYGETFLPDQRNSRYYQAWLSYVSACVDSLSQFIKYWEIINEPNIFTLWRDTSLMYSDYSQLVKETSNIIRSRDPQAKVILGGTALVDVNFVNECFKNGVAGFLNKVGFHPYRSMPEIKEDLNWKPNLRYVNPYTDYEGEIKALKDTISKYSTNIKIWDTEGCYLSDTILSSPLKYSATEITQAKYLLRRYFMNLGLEVDLTTWSVMWDFQSILGNAGNSDWVNDYRDRKSGYFYGWEVAPFAGIIYTLQGWNPYSRQSENYARIDTPMVRIFDIRAESLWAVWTPYGKGARGEVEYDLSLSSGIYNLWTRSLRDSIPGSIFTLDIDTLWRGGMFGNFYTTSNYAWACASDSLNWKFIKFLRVGGGNYNMKVKPFWLDGSRFDAYKFVRVDTNCALKQAYTSLQNITTLFDEKIVKDTTTQVILERINVPDSAWAKRKNFVFRDTSNGNVLIPYWLGLIADDIYPQNQYVRLRVRLDTSRVRRPIWINMLSGDFFEKSFRVDTSGIVFDSLSVADFPYLIMMDGRKFLGIEKNSNAKIYVSDLRLEQNYPNPFSIETNIKFKIPNKNKVSLKIYDVTGRLVRTLVDGYREAGIYVIQWDGKNDIKKEMPNGVYFVQLKVEDTLFQAHEKTIRILKIR